MKVRYEAYSKSGPQPLKVKGPLTSQGVVFGADHNTRMKPIKPQMAADILERDDGRAKGSDTRLSKNQRLTLLRIAGDKYGKGKKVARKSKGRKPADPYQKRAGESTEEYITRINQLLKP